VKKPRIFKSPKNPGKNNTIRTTQIRRSFLNSLHAGSNPSLETGTMGSQTYFSLGANQTIPHTETALDLTSPH
jgi:hypothetical protein